MGPDLLILGSGEQGHDLSGLVAERDRIRSQSPSFVTSAGCYLGGGGD